MAPPASAIRWRLLRKADDTFTGHDDNAALVVLDGEEKSVVDRTTLVNGQTYYYRLYWFDGTSWTATPTVQVAVLATYGEVTEDALMLVRERLEQGLLVEVQRGKLRHPKNRIKCLTAFPWGTDNPWPVVTVHLSSGSSDVRAVGELLDSDSYDLNEDSWTEGEGWFERFRLDVIGWSQNPDERQELRQAIRRIIIGNLPVFEDAGMINIDLNQMDQEEPGDKNTIIYKSVGVLSGLIPVQVTGETDAIDDVEVNAQSL